MIQFSPSFFLCRNKNCVQISYAAATPSPPSFRQKLTIQLSLKMYYSLKRLTRQLPYIKSLNSDHSAFYHSLCASDANRHFSTCRMSFFWGIYRLSRLFNRRNVSVCRGLRIIHKKNIIVYNYIQGRLWINIFLQMLKFQTFYAIIQISYPQFFSVVSK